MNVYAGNCTQLSAEEIESTEVNFFLLASLMRIGEIGQFEVFLFFISRL